MAGHTGVTIIDGSGRQVRILLPPALVARFPGSYMAEVDIAPDRQSLIVTLVPRDKKGLVRKYSIVHHKGSAMLSVPRHLLFELHANPGDTLNVEETGHATASITKAP